MSIRNLDKIFKPSHVVVVGASDQTASVGYTLLHNLLTTGFEGEVFAVNPNRDSVQGIQSYPSVAALPRTPDLAVIATPARTVPGLIRECGEGGISGVIVISAGFREAGAEGKTLEGQVRETGSAFPGMRIIGPNCLGVIVPRLGLNITFTSGMPKSGGVAFISQSGALCTAVLDWALEEDIGFSHFVSTGNMLDVDFGDLIDYLNEDAETRSIIVYVESITGARKFISASRAFTRTKPIVVYKAGRFEASAKAAASHTGALAGEDAVYDAAFSRAGLVRIFRSDDMFDVAELLARQRFPHRDRLAILTNAGGPGVMAVDMLVSLQGRLAQLSEETLRKLDAVLPHHWSKGNPIDLIGDAPPERYERAMALA
ncbi:MAG: acetate--CoA ligase family protein, partial [Vicinamibacteria bacterium]